MRADPVRFPSRRIAVIAATLLPLLAYLGWGAARGALSPEMLIVLGLATLAGAAIVLLAVGAPERGEAGVHPVVAAQRDLAAKEDLLTGVRNRRGFVADVGDLLPAERAGAIALIDLDRFRELNDSLGHAEGDRVLRAFAARLSSELRRGDLVARWSGKEFAMLFRGASADAAASVLARVAGRLRTDPLVLLDGVPPSFSAGVADFGDDMLDAALNRAEAALDDARRTGPGSIVSSESLPSALPPG